MTCKNIYFFGAALLALTLGACNNNRPSYSSDTTTPVWLGDVIRRDIREITTITGTAKATQTVEIKSEVTGKYHLQQNPRTGKPYKLGDVVENGAVIIRLENPQVVSSAAIETKKMQIGINEREWKGNQLIYEKGGVTEKDVLSAELNYINSKTALEDAQRELDKLTLRAPFKGVITKLPHYTSDVDIASGETMFELMDFSRMYMEIELPENAMGKVEAGQRVFVTNYNIKSDTLNGQISQLSPAINETTRTFSGFVSIDNPELKLRPGMFAKADIVTLQKDTVLVIPKNIIRRMYNNSVVYTIERNMAQERSIRTGISDDTYIEVESGLKDGDKVVVKGYEWLRNRAAVKIMK